MPGFDFFWKDSASAESFFFQPPAAGAASPAPRASFRRHWARASLPGGWGLLMFRFASLVKAAGFVFPGFIEGEEVLKAPFTLLGS
ncbi:hypothetical protein [Syntrophomonas curvata]